MPTSLDMTLAAFCRTLYGISLTLSTSSEPLSFSPHPVGAEGRIELLCFTRVTEMALAFATSRRAMLVGKLKGGVGGAVEIRESGSTTIGLGGLAAETLMRTIWVPAVLPAWCLDV